MHKQKNSSPRPRRKILLAAAGILFYSAMLLLALIARRLHESRLPEVTVTAPVIYTAWEDDTFTTTLLLPQICAQSDRLFVIANEQINGEIRTIAREITGLSFRTASDGYCEVIGGLSMTASVIVDKTGSLSDGDEVLIKGEWKNDGY